ncbi:MAG: hypothetical protein AAF841_12800 [Pseudomonadota bacterium]
MLRFLFGDRKGTPKVETQREAFERLVKELNEAIGALAVKPKITVDPNTGALDLAAPEQFPDEALALPAPEPEQDAKADTAEAAKAKPAAPKPAPPKPNPPKSAKPNPENSKAA